MNGIGITLKGRWCDIIVEDVILMNILRVINFNGNYPIKYKLRNQVRYTVDSASHY
jgi:hypothetical protein